MVESLPGGGGDSGRPQVEKTPQSSLRVADSMSKDPDFIKVGFHMGRFVTGTVNTEPEQTDI
jgi:hypothetical protein